jgi:hypothetical protein
MDGAPGILVPTHADDEAVVMDGAPAVVYVRDGVTTSEK